MTTRGAEFRKCDLQIHSPRDGGWDGARPDQTATTPQEIVLARTEWTKTFLAKCVEQGLRAIAITDHHEGEYVFEAIRLAAAEDLDLWVFPGMELTCKDSCQALLIFDANIEKVIFEKARSKLGLPAQTNPDRVQGIQVELLAHNLEDIQDLLESDEELQGRFIVLPHVKPGGHKTVLRQGFHRRFKEMPYVGGYMDATYPDDLNAGDRRILDGEIPAWSSEKRGVISTSDARHANFRLIGQHATWIKLAEPTAESLRQAMLAPDSRIRYSAPRLPKTIIKSVTIHGSTYVGAAAYELNQQLNVIIGGRGAGKSSFLEYIRFCLGCSAIDIATDDHPTKRMGEMLEATLDPTDGRVTVELLINGALTTVERRMASRGVAVLTTSDGAPRTIAPADVRRLIPVQTFRQGELSDLGAEEAESRLIELVIADSRDELDRLEQNLKEIDSQFSEVLGRRMRLSTEEAKLRLLQTEHELTQSQIGSLNEQLQAAGSPPSSAIAEHDKYETEATRTINLREQVTEAAQSIRKSIENARELVINAFPRQAALQEPELEALYRGVESLFGIELKSPMPEEAADSSHFAIASKQFTDALRNIEESIDVLFMPWEEKLEAHRAEYATQAAGLVGQEAMVKELAALTDKLQGTGQRSEQSLQQVMLLRNAGQELARLRSQKTNTEDQISAEIRQQSERVSEASSGFARGSIADLPALDGVAIALRSILAVPHMREQRIEAAIEQIRKSGDPRTSWRALVDELIALLEWKEGGSLTDGNRPQTPILQEALDDNFMDRLVAKLTQEDVLTALKVSISPRIEIVQTRNDTEIQFKKASQGEQAATLLNILMNQAIGPLIIDQPEEDLDNRIINDIIKTIRATKNDRQLILATHNANITVNGDAELVIELSNGQLANRGAIDEAGLRAAITETMEGGRDAFELRRKKYNF